MVQMVTSTTHLAALLTKYSPNKRSWKGRERGAAQVWSQRKTETMKIRPLIKEERARWQKRIRRVSLQSLSTKRTPKARKMRGQTVNAHTTPSTTKPRSKFSRIAIWQEEFPKLSKKRPQELALMPRTANRQRAEMIGKAHQRWIPRKLKLNSNRI